jgi:hypothetical protein
VGVRPGSFVEGAEKVVLLGVGKAHLAIALGIKVVEGGHAVLFLALEGLMGRLVPPAMKTASAGSCSSWPAPASSSSMSWVSAADAGEASTSFGSSSGVASGPASS